MRSFYPDMYTEDAATNRVLHFDDEEESHEIALREPVIQLYPPSLTSSGIPNTFRCIFEVAAKQYDDALRLADEALTQLASNPRKAASYNPRTEAVRATGYSRLRVIFDLKTKPTP